MTEMADLLTRIVEAEPLPEYRLRLRYADGAAGVADLSGLFAKGGVFAALSGSRFGAFALTQGGRAVCWLDEAGREIDLDADALRRMLGNERAAAE